MRRWLIPSITLAVVAGAVLAAAGRTTPRMRHGSLPFPGKFTLYTPACTEDLGVHRHGPWIDRLGEPDEKSGGILYTRQAGFLDLAHIREYVDWGKYHYDKALEALLTPARTFEYSWSGSTFRVTCTPPDSFSSGTDCEARAEAMANLFAQRMVVLLGTWHEAATWHGQSTFPGISETRSAFTWDDTTSHVVAARITARALALNLSDWDAAVTRALEAELRELDAVDQALGAQAVEAIRGDWWTDVGENAPAPLRRDFETGLDTGRKTPWLVKVLPALAPASGVARELPLAAWPLAPDGTDLSRVFRVEATASHDLLARMLGEPESDRTELPRWVSPEAEMPGMVARIRAQFERTMIAHRTP